MAIMLNNQRVSFYLPCTATDLTSSLYLLLAKSPTIHGLDISVGFFMRLTIDDHTLCTLFQVKTTIHNSPFPWPILDTLSTIH
jgi:hypothetical protein